jgi:hypothetical protein
LLRYIDSFNKVVIRLTVCEMKQLTELHPLKQPREELLGIPYDSLY